MSWFALLGLKVEMTDCFLYFIYKSFKCGSSKIFIRLTSKINYKLINTFFVAAKCSLPVNELDKNALLAHVLLIYNKLLRQNTLLAYILLIYYLL